jgi:hypothetical protein
MRHRVNHKKQFSYLPQYLLALIVLILGCLYFGERFWNNLTPSMHVSSNSTRLSAAQFRYESSKLQYLMEHDGISAAFNYVSQKIATDPSFAKDCHPLLHDLGHAAFSYFGGYSQAIGHQNEICDSGYTHGVLEEYLSSVPNMEMALTKACSTTNGQNFTQWQCYHGLGHGIMLASNQNVIKSLKFCENFTLSFNQEACANGVFMQHFELTDHEGNIPSANPTSLNDCTYKGVIYRSDCYYYAPAAFLTINNAEYYSALKWCYGAGSNYISTCIAGVGGQTMKENINDSEVAKRICLAADKMYRAACVNGAVGMYIFFYSSSSVAQPLCKKEFSIYQTACQSAIDYAKNNLKI